MGPPWQSWTYGQEEEHLRKGSRTAKQQVRVLMKTSRRLRKRLRLRLPSGEPLGIEPAAGLVKLAARRPARECMLGDRPLLPTRCSHRVPCCLPRPTSRRAYTIPGIARQWTWHQATFMRMGTHSTPGCSRFPAAFEEPFQSIDRTLILSVELKLKT